MGSTDVGRDEGRLQLFSVSLFCSFFVCFCNIWDKTGVLGLGKQREKRRSPCSLPGFLAVKTYGVAVGAC